MTGNKDNRNVGRCAETALEIQAVLVAELEVKDDQIHGLVRYNASHPATVGPRG